MSPYSLVYVISLPSSRIFSIVKGNLLTENSTSLVVSPTVPPLRSTSRASPFFILSALHKGTGKHGLIKLPIRMHTANFARTALAPLILMTTAFSLGEPRTNTSSLPSREGCSNASWEGVSPAYSGAFPRHLLAWDVSPWGQ